MKKKLHLIKFLALMLALMWIIPLQAQRSEGGTPPSFGLPTLRQSTQAHKVPVNFNVNELKAEDAKNEAIGAPIRAAIIIPSTLSIENDGKWTDLPDGQRIWQLEISAPDAIALMLYYDDFYIPQGGKLFIYNEKKNHILGAYTHKTNIQGGKFATEFVAGDKLIMEYVAAPKDTIGIEGLPVVEKEMPRIKISGISYGYNHLDVYVVKNETPQLRVGESESCMININCPEGDNWQVQKRGVAKSLTPIGTGAYLCSGTILNNTAEDLNPYFLTASHCFYNDAVNLKCTNFGQVIYYFNYESFGCETTYPNQARTLVGAELLVELPVIGGIAGTGGTDGALLRLLNPIPADYNVYYNGWDKRNIAPTSGVGIHHPAGDIKKISTYTTTPTQTTWTGGPTNQWWNVRWASTVSGKSLTEGGSSGSPLFNQDGRVVGSLTGGPTQPGVPKCQQPSTYHLAYYGKLSYHWDGLNSINNATTMSTYLDPNNAGVDYIDGTYAANATGGATAFFTNDFNKITVLNAVNFKDASVNATSWKWTFEGGTPGTFNGKTPPAIVYNTPSPVAGFTAKLVINEGTANEKSYEVKIHVKEPGINPQVPVARFSFDKTVEMQQGFDAAFAGLGWTITKPGASANSWIRNNLNSAALNFSSIEPTSISSALVQQDNANLVDTWLISPEYEVKTGSWIDFYALYATLYTDANRYLSLSVTTDNGANWTEIWTNADHTGVDNLAWYKNTVSLVEFEGQHVKFGFRYYGQGGYFGGIDGVKLYSPVAPTPQTIGINETVTPVEWSSGPPISFEWTFENGTPATSTKQNPGPIQYTQVGTFDITLKVKNYQGEHTYTFVDAVTVNVLVPEPIFSSESNALIMQANQGQFLPLSGGPVTFTDLSKNYPTSWEWTLPGATPATSTDQNVDVNYSAGVNSYPVTLVATNTAGTENLTIPDYVKVGGTAEVWNVLYGESPTTRYASGGYGMTGADIFPQTAERFAAPAEGEVSKVRVYTQNVTAGSAQMTVAIYSDNNGLPGVALSPVMTINGASIANGGYNTITFPNPVGVSGAFHVVVGSTNYNSTYFTVPSVPIRTSGYNTVSVYTNVWAPLSTRFSGHYLSMNIIPEFTYTETIISLPIATFKKKNIDSSPETVNMNIQTTASGLWTATTSDPWIHLSTSSGALSQPSFTFTCDENLGDLRSGYIAVSVGGVTKYAVVLQAGVAPANLVATYNTTDLTADLAWTHKGVQEGDIFDNAEGHTSFTINSAGTVGWSYIDGDGSATYPIIGVSYPGSGSAMAFAVFAPSQTTPASIAANTQPHSGNKYFACFAATTPSNNDWMISPLLGFSTNFKFSFWAKSATSQYTGGERIRVAYSTSSNAQADFTNVLTAAPYVVVPQTAWTRYEFTVPANAKYVAINCVTNDEFFLMIDDIFIGRGMSPLSAPALNPIASLSPSPDMLEKASAAITNSDILKKTNAIIAASQSSMPVVTPVKANKWRLEASENAPANVTQNQLRSTAVETKLRWDNGTNYEAIGVSTGADIEVAILFDQKDLLKYHGTKIKAVEIFPRNLGNNMVLNIRKGGVIVYSQPLAGLTANTFNQIVLTTPITLDATETLTIGYAYTQLPGLYVAGCDAGPAKRGKGDLISLNGSPFEALSSFSTLNYNWNIAVVLEDNSGSNSDITFNVYRDNVLVTSGLTPKTYKNPITLGDNACYTVTAVHNADTELETTYSNEACLDALSEIIVQPINVSRYQYAENPAFGFTITGNLMGLHTEAEVRSWITTSSTASSNSLPGDYPIVATVNNLEPNAYVFKLLAGTLTVIGRDFPTITEQPQGAVVCAGSNYTLSVKATGDNLRYQWYKGNNPIMGATNSSLELKNVSYADYEMYYVLVKNDITSIYSEKVTIYVTNTLSSLSFAEFPSTAYIGTTYPVKLNGYSNVTKYTWSFNKENAAVFAPESGSKNETKVTFNQNAVGIGTLNVDMEHPCGVYSLSKEVNVKYPTGMDDINNPTVEVYPNPVSNVLNISYNQQIIKSVIINDVSGRTIERHNNVDSNLLTIQTSKWNKGTYVVIIETDNGKTVRKVIKK